jgi:hypothetical protein
MTLPWSTPAGGWQQPLQGVDKYSDFLYFPSEDGKSVVIQHFQLPVFAEHLYSVHFVCTRPTQKVDHHDCVCVCHNNK